MAIITDSYSYYYLLINYPTVLIAPGSWYYFAGLNPVFSHEENDVASFYMFTSQLIASGQCRNVDIIKVFGVSPSKVKRGVKQYKEKCIN